jgi:hypothetical protein
MAREDARDLLGCPAVVEALPTVGAVGREVFADDQSCRAQQRSEFLVEVGYVVERVDDPHRVSYDG